MKRKAQQHESFSEDDIRCDGLPREVFKLLHDLCYHHDGRDVWNYVERAQQILTSTNPAGRATKRMTRNER